ncbi:hypothetical protein IW252_002596 [Zhihengliuella flava]|uniref:Uncharacterized protein n=1 Tax=Zhihengliuella flava TaxID=1285193 RepID=A0A931D7E7_9MICC|nr:hypothetical protein [Zhihengliuella flava]
MSTGVTTPPARRYRVRQIVISKRREWRVYDPAGTLIEIPDTWAGAVAMAHNEARNDQARRWHGKTAT